MTGITKILGASNFLFEKIMPYMLRMKQKIEKMGKGLINILKNYRTIKDTTQDHQRRFSSYLMTVIAILVTGSVVLISGVLYIYFGKRLDSEFTKKILAQKGQMEIMLEDRIAQVKRRLKDLHSDNTIRFTMMMGDTSQLEERIKQFYTNEGSVYFYVKKKGQKSIYPKKHPDLSNKMVDVLLASPTSGKIIEEGDKTRLVWWFEAPIIHRKKLMGTVYALYDMAQDRELMRTIHKTVDGDISIAKTDRLLSLFTGVSLPFETVKLKKDPLKSEFLYLDPDTILSQFNRYKNLYFISSQKSLLREKRRISLLIGFFSILVLAFSVTMSLFLGRKMARPLGEIAAKAIQISYGQKALSFERSSSSYWEFNQLSQAFHYMLANLKEAEEKSRYNELLENVDDAVYLIDREGKILEANEATYLQLGYSPEIFFHSDLAKILPEKDAKILLDQLDDSNQKQDKGKMTFETYHLRSDGKSIPVEIKSRLISYRGKEVILNVARDISERMEAEKALRESEERYRSVVENSHDGILIVDDRFIIIYVNNELCRILGYSRKEIEGREFKKFLAEESVPTVKDSFFPESKVGKGKPLDQFNIVRKDGEQRQCKISATMIEDSVGKVKTVVQILDITDQFRAEQEKKQLEAQLLHAQKMEAIGTLAGGVAHDFNNLLQAIQGYSDLLLLRKNKDEIDYRELKEIKLATQSASELTQQLLTFSRKVETKLRPVNLNHEVRQVHKLLRRTIPQMIETELRLADNLGTIDADPAQLGQVIMNLGVNARDAMPEGGRLLIETEMVTLDKKYCKAHLGASAGDYVLLTISDTGHGMDKKELEHIFEPFYTTKEVGKGTGLGLAIVYGIVKSHRGYIMCYSEPGEGTIFKVYLPVIEQDATLEEAKDGEIQTGGTETILLVDDDERILNLGDEMLSKHGYKVITAPDGETALKLYHQKKEEINLVILDLVMPGMGGSKCLEELLKIDPKARVIMASGYSPNGHAKNAIDLGAKGFVGKPYELGRILKIVREVLDDKKNNK